MAGRRRAVRSCPVFRHERSAQNDDQRVERQEPGGRHIEAQHHLVHPVAHIEIHDAAIGLLADHVDGGEEHHDQHQLHAGIAPDRGFGAIRVLAQWLYEGGEKPPAEPQECRQADHHAHAGRQESPGPSCALAQCARTIGRAEGAQVDAHIEQHEAVLAAMVAGGEQLAHQRADIGLEHARAHDHRRQPAIEQQEVQPRGVRCRRAGRSQQEVGAGQAQTADHHRPEGADQPVGDPAAQQRGHEDHAHGDAEQLEGGALVHAQPA
jgi:hypothetical protein